MGVRTVAAFALSAALVAGCSGGPGRSSVPETTNLNRVVAPETGTALAVSVVDIGSLPGYGQESDAFAANNNGDAVGRVCCSSPYETAVLYRKGVLHSLGGLPGYSGSEANAINDYGVAVGVT